MSVYATTFEKMALTATEDWICERIQLKHDNLEDVRSLTLPGTYQDKICHLGHSLRNFLRLKHLDLSRNSLTSLDGLEHLKMLDRLNLYYNNISSLDELHKLRHNTKLEELDLRLNPVTRDEPDYRLFLIHLLPSLRKLDDRGVRDSERRAALMHFGTSQAYELTEPSPREPVPEKKANPRVEMVNSMKKTGVLDDDDVAMLDLIARTGGDLNQPRTITGSTASRPAKEEYSLDAVHQMESEEARESAPVSSSRRQHQEELSPSQSHSKASSVVGTPRRDSNLKYQDEIEAYTSYKSHGTFTPHPRPPDDPVKSKGQSSQDLSYQPSQSNTAHKVYPSCSAQSDSSENQYPFLSKLLDLVDKYWNGSKSLHRNKRFTKQADAIFTEFLGSNPLSGEVSKLQQQNQELGRENRLLQEQLNECQQREEPVEQTQSQTVALQQRLKKAYEENTSLRQRLEHSETLLAGGGLHGTTVRSGSGDRSHTDELMQQNSVLKQEVDMLKIRLKQFSQMQELASMLQESHKSLVQTNEHLLKEIEDNRQRHDAEVQQLHWSFDQMKKTTGMMSNAETPRSMNGSR